MFRIINYFTKQTKQTMTIIIVTQDKLVQIKIFFWFNVRNVHQCFRPLHLSDCFTSHYVCDYSDVLVAGTSPSGFGFWSCFWQEQLRDSQLTSHNTKHYTFPMACFCLCQCASQPLISHHSCSTRLATWEKEACNYVKRLNTQLSTTAESEHTGYPPAQRRILDFRVPNQSSNSFSPPGSACHSNSVCQVFVKNNIILCKALAASDRLDNFKWAGRLSCECSARPPVKSFWSVLGVSEESMPNNTLGPSGLFLVI